MKLLLTLVAAAAAVLPQVAEQRHAPRSAREYARVLDDPSRAAWQKPDEVVNALALRPDEVIADIGAGTGYFARRFAPVVAKVYAVDINADLLKIAKAGAPGNLVPVLATADDPKLPAGSVDTVFICDVLHHIENRPAYYQKLKRALKPGGRVVNIDFQKRALPVGPPEPMKIAKDDVIAEFKAAGFKLAQTFDFLPYQYFLIFRTE